MTDTLEEKKRTPLEQLARLEARGAGHCREAAKIRAQLSAATVEKKPEPAVEQPKKAKTKAKDRRANA